MCWPMNIKLLQTLFCDIKNNLRCTVNMPISNVWSAPLFCFHIECYMYTVYIKLYVALGNLTDLCLTWTWSYTKNLSGKQRVWIQIRPTFDTSRHRAKGICFQNGVCCLVCPPSHARIQDFLLVGGRGGSKPY